MRSAAALLLAGCATSAGPRTVCGDADHLSAAAGAWGLRITGEPCDVYVVRGDPGKLATTKHFGGDEPFWVVTLGNTAGYDEQTVLTHELGHAMGLEHLPEPSAVMFESIAPGERRRELTRWDLEALEAVR